METIVTACSKTNLLTAESIFYIISDCKEKKIKLNTHAVKLAQGLRIIIMDSLHNLPLNFKSLKKWRLAKKSLLVIIDLNS